MAKKKKVFVLYKDGEFVVEPAAVELEFKPAVAPNPADADEIKLINRTNEDVIWNFRHNGVLQGGPFTEFVERRKFSAAKAALNAPGVWEYQVLVVESGKKAKGNSDPVIIIENP